MCLSRLLGRGSKCFRGGVGAAETVRVGLGASYVIFLSSSTKGYA